MTDWRVLDPETLRAWRKSRGMTKREAGLLLQIPMRTLETLEAGRSPSSALWGPLGRIIQLLEEMER